MRIVLGILFGLIVAAITVLIVSTIGDLLFPSATSDADLRNPEQAASAFNAAPLGSRLSLVFAWLGGSFAGGAVARLVSRAGWTAWAIAMLVLLTSLAVIFIIAMPLWLQVAMIVAPLLGGFLARHYPAERTRAEVLDG